MPSGRDLSFDLSGLTLRIRNLPDPLAERLAQDWAPFRSSGDPDPVLDVDTSLLEAPKEIGGRFARYAARVSADGARYLMDEGSVEVNRGGRARARIASTPDAVGYYALVNLLCAAAGWRLQSSGGGVLHAAGIVVAGEAFALVGGSGAGKSTWAALAHAQGASVLSDDVLFVAPARSGLVATSVPFRSGLPVSATVPEGTRMPPGRWPLRALLFPEKGEEVRVQPMSRLVARGALVANLLYADGAHDPATTAGRFIERLIAEIPLKRLTFALRPDFLPALAVRS